jgi:hypothetical protein
MALLDLLDNSIDATLHQPEFNAHVHIQVLSSANATGMIIANNACDPIKPLCDCLKIYDSAKEGNDSYIGENGVGYVKHNTNNKHRFLLLGLFVNYHLSVNLCFFLKN